MSRRRGPVYRDPDLWRIDVACLGREPNRHGDRLVDRWQWWRGGYSDEFFDPPALLVWNVEDSRWRPIAGGQPREYRCPTCGWSVRWSRATAMRLADRQSLRRMHTLDLSDPASV